MRVLDGDSLVHWLELHGGVAEWFAVRIGRRPVGLRNLSEVREEWSLAIKHPLTPEIVGADRDEEAVPLRWRQAYRALSMLIRLNDLPADAGRIMRRG